MATKKKAATKKKDPASARTTRAEAVIELLSSKDGVTVPELMKRFGWLAHTTRAALSVTNRKHKLGMTSVVEEDRGRVYKAKAIK